MAVELETKVIVKPDYETVMIVTPDVSEADYKKVVDKFTKIIKDADGEIINTEHWGTRKLAYPIKKKTSGYYTYIEFKVKPELISKLEQEFIYDDNVIRYLTVKLDHHHKAYNEKRRSIRKAEA